jgi:hypothetical protein
MVKKHLFHSLPEQKEHGLLMTVRLELTRIAPLVDAGVPTLQLPLNSSCS